MSGKSVAPYQALRRSRDYKRTNRLPRGLYGDPMFQQLSPIKPSAQGLLVWFMAGPYANGAPGVFHMGTHAMAEAIGWSERSVRRGLKELIDFGFMEFDSKYKLGFSEYILSFRYPETITVATHWARQIARLPRCPMRNKIAQVVGLRVQNYGPKHYERFVHELGISLPENMMRERTRHVHIEPPAMDAIAPIKDVVIPEDQGTGELYDEPVLVRIPCKDAEHCEIRESVFLEWVEQFPLINVPAELEILVREIHSGSTFMPSLRSAKFWVEQRLELLSSQKKQSSVLSDDLPAPLSDDTG